MMNEFFLEEWIEEFEDFIEFMSVENMVLIELLFVMIDIFVDGFYLECYEMFCCFFEECVCVIFFGGEYVFMNGYKCILRVFN